jgi:PrtD family type I secretion system ABC transporter
MRAGQGNREENVRPFHLPGRQPLANAQRLTPLNNVIRIAQPVVWTLLVLSLFANMLRLTIPLYMLQLMERVLSSRSEDTLLYLTLMAAVALGVGATLSSTIQILQTRVGSWIEQQLFAPVLVASLDGQLIGQSMGLHALRDLGQVRSFISGPALTTLLDAPWLPIFIFVIFLLHTWLGLIAIAAAAILLLIAVVNDLLIRNRQKASGQQTNRLYQEVEDGMRHAMIVHAMGLLPSYVAKTEKIAATARDDQDVVQERNAAVSGLSRFIRQLAQIAMLGTGAYLVLENEVTSGVMIAGSILLGTALQPVDRAIMAWRSVVTAWMAHKRLQQQFVTVKERTAGDTALSNLGGHLNVRQAMYMPPGRGRPVIRPMNFEVAPGEVLAILGPSGAGKSILCELLVGVLSPSSGSVHLDNLDLHRQLSGNIGKHVGFLSQDPMLFSATVAENISRLDDAAQSAQADEIVSAARLANVHDVILDLPGRYQTPIDDSTPVLSRSQKQRVALARAFFGRPRLIVLDEPTAFLDRAGEGALITALKELQQHGSTIVLVTQNSRIVSMCDKLLFMRDGMIEAYGDPGRVLSIIREENGGLQERRRRRYQIMSAPDQKEQKLVSAQQK